MAKSIISLLLSCFSLAMASEILPRDDQGAVDRLRATSKAMAAKYIIESSSVRDVVRYNIQELASYSLGILVGKGVVRGQLDCTQLITGYMMAYRGETFWDAEVANKNKDFMEKMLHEARPVEYAFGLSEDQKSSENLKRLSVLYGVKLESCFSDTGPLIPDPFVLGVVARTTAENISRKMEGEQKEKFIDEYLGIKCSRTNEVDADYKRYLKEAKALNAPGAFKLKDTQLCYRGIYGAILAWKVPQHPSPYSVEGHLLWSRQLCLELESAIAEVDKSTLLEADTEVVSAGREVSQWLNAIKENRRSLIVDISHIKKSINEFTGGVDAVSALISKDVDEANNISFWANLGASLAADQNVKDILQERKRSLSVLMGNDSMKKLTAAYDRAFLRALDVKRQ